VAPRRTQGVLRPDPRRGSRGAVGGDLGLIQLGETYLWGPGFNLGRSRSAWRTSIAIRLTPPERPTNLLVR